MQGLELAVPGTYIAGEPVVTIAAFAPQLHVITSKQRPRKLTIHGSDGAEYMFLLKVRHISRLRLELPLLMLIRNRSLYKEGVERRGHRYKHALSSSHGAGA